MSQETLYGIILRTVKYSDNSLIVTAYTKENGLRSYMVRGIHSRTSKAKVNYFQSLAFLKFMAATSKNDRLSHIKEVMAVKSFTQELTPTKNLIAVFLQEILVKTLREEEPHPEIVEFLETAFKLFQLKEGSCANFHLVFMLKFTQLLGFPPMDNYSNANPFFSLGDGKFLAHKPINGHFLDEEVSSVFHQLLGVNLAESESIPLNQSQRKKLLNTIIHYYQFHHALAGEITSLSVLEQL